MQKYALVNRWSYMNLDGGGAMERVQTLQLIPVEFVHIEYAWGEQNGVEVEGIDKNQSDEVLGYYYRAEDVDAGNKFGVAAEKLYAGDAVVVNPDGSVCKAKLAE